MKKVLICLLPLIALSGCFWQEKKNTSVTHETTNASSIPKKKAASSETTTTSTDTDPRLLRNSPKFNTIAKNTGAKDAFIVSTQQYEVLLEDDKWAGVAITVDDCSILKLKDYHDKDGNQYQGYVVLHFKVVGGDKDVNLDPDSGLLTTNLGQQTQGNHAFDSFGGVLKAHEKKQGSFAYPLTELEFANAITNVHLTFHGSLVDGDEKDPDLRHEYQFQLNKQ